MVTTMSMTKTRLYCGSNLPEEVLLRILSWTCVPCLVRCKSVCKSWLSSISDPQFATSHHNNSRIKLPSVLMITCVASPQVKLPVNYDDEHKRLPVDYEDEQGYGRLSVNIFYSDSLEHSVIIPLMPPFDFMDIVASCNGIVCVSNAEGSDIHLLNPFTRMSRRLPAHVVPIVSGGDHSQRPCRYDVVFGFHAVSNEFKVLKIVYRRLNYRLVSAVSVHLYSSNAADSWREIKVGVELPSMVCYPLSPILKSGPVVDGILFLEGMDVIVTFDLHTELFGVVPFPSFMQIRKSNVFDFEGSVSVLVESVPGDGSLDDKEISLWTLEIVSSESFWNKIFTFDSGCELDWVFFYLGANQFVGTTKLGTVLYESRKKVTKYIGLPPQTFYKTVHKHTESLLSVEEFERAEES